MLDIVVYIMTRDRPGMLERCVRSFASIDVSLIISDNSSVYREYPFIQRERIIRRGGELSAIDHFNLILDETPNKYVMIFHDDDYIIDMNFQKFLNEIARHSGFSAYACGHLTENINDLIDNTLTRKFQKLDLLTTSVVRELYLSPFSSRVPPLTGYVWDIDLIRHTRLDASKGGKFSDAAFIHDISLTGPIKFFNIPAVVSVKHDGNDQNSFTVQDYKRLYTYLYPIVLRNYFSVYHLYRISRFFKSYRQRLAGYLLFKVFCYQSLYVLIRLISKVRDKL